MVLGFITVIDQLDSSILDMNSDEKAAGYDAYHTVCE